MDEIDKFEKLYTKHRAACSQISTLYVLLTNDRKNRLRDFAWALMQDQRNNEGQAIELQKEG